MGADGGVAWVTLRNEGDRGALHSLFLPWWDDLSELSSSTPGDSRSDFIFEHLGPCDVAGGYGTDLDDLLSWSDLDEWVAQLDDALTDPSHGLSETSTFADYLEEQDTRPDGWCSTAFAAKEWDDGLRQRGGRLLEVRIAWWLERVRDLLVSTRAHREETWT